MARFCRLRLTLTRFRVLVRRYPTFVFVIALGCADDTAPPFDSCGVSTAASSDLCGTWAAASMVPGSSLVLDIRLHDTTITGTGTYSLEAGRSGGLQLAGSYHPPAIALTFRYDYGNVLTYTGTVTRSRQITGILADSNGHTSPLTFNPR